MSTIQLTYKPVNNNLDDLVRDAQKLAYKHTVKASGMREQLFFTIVHVSTACIMKCPEPQLRPLNFMLRTVPIISSEVLYHYSAPNPDSLAPVTNFMREEIWN